MPEQTLNSINFWSIFTKITNFFASFFNPSYHLPYLGNGLKIVFSVFSIFFIFIIAYSLIRVIEIRKKEHEHLHHEIEEYRKRRVEEEMKEAEESSSLNKRWDIVLQYLFSAYQGDWKLAVIEADSMLEALMTQLGFKGENLGEKLKTVDKERYPSLVSTWEAHMVRNKIAHEGEAFQLSHQEAKRIIAIYEQVFKEFRFI